MVEPSAQVHVSEANQSDVFVGPRPFERSEQNLFFGRDREISELLSLVTSNRVVLCYAPSGAGKTSLINAGLHPRLEKEGFEVLPSTRVRGLIHEGVDQTSVANIYIFNAVLSLAKETGDPAELARTTLSKFLATVPHLTDEENFPSPRILIFDQFEELLTSYLERWQERDGFFHQVHDALQDDPLLRVLFVMREDYVARIEPFMRILKPLQQTRFRLDLLGPAGAHAAVTRPLRGTTRHFKDGVVDTLVEELLKVRVESTHGEATEVIGEYVEPVQLQVVCRNLWNSLPGEVQEISDEHVKAYGDVDQALHEFYESCLTSAKTEFHPHEADLREWFERQLITPAGTRGIVFRDAQQTAGLPNSVVDFLENKHIIRGEWRAGSRWYELTHDRLIEPIQRANERWRAQRQARRNRIFGLAGAALVLALMLFAITFSFQRGTAAAPPDSTVVAAATSAIENATLAGDAQSTTVAILSTSVAVQADASLSKSRQLAAEALLATDRNLSLLLAIEANRSDDTLEARRSLHQVLSGQGVIDGEFLRELNAEILSPTLVRRLRNHNGPVVSVSVSPDGQRFVSGSTNGTVLIWDFVTAQPIGTSLTTRNNSISSVAYSPDGRLVASAGLDQQITLWDVSTEKVFGIPLRGHTGLVTCIAFSPDGKLLASGGMDQQVLIWDVQNQGLVAALEDLDTIGSLAWSPDSKILAWGSYSSNVTFWKNISPEPYDTLRIEGEPILSIAWSPDGQTLAFGMGSQESRPENGDVLLWDFANRKPIIRPLPNNRVRVRSVSFDESGETLAVGRDDGSIVLWDVASQQTVGNPILAHSHRVMSIAFSPDGRYLISAGYEGAIAVWNLEAATNTIAVSPNGDLLAASQGSLISVWNLQNSETAAPKILSAHTDVVLALAFSPEGETLVSSGKDNLILFWDAETGEQLDVAIRTLSNVQTLQFSPDGRTLAAGGDSGRAQLSNPLTGQVLHQLVELNRPVLKVQFNEDGTTLDVVGSDGSLITFDLQSSGPRKIAESVLQSVQDAILSVAIPPDAKRVAYFQAGGTGETVVLSNDKRAHGMILSYWDQSFDPNATRGDIDFVILKATEGNQYVDPSFNEYLRTTGSIPMRGAFHFYRENIPWKEQADHFLSTVEGQELHFYVLDLEVVPKDGDMDFLADAEQWLKYVDEKLEGPVMLLTANSYQESLGPAGDWMKDWPLLIIDYPSTPDRNGDPSLPKGFQDWRIWNYTDNGNGPEYGVAANRVFLAVYNGTAAEMGQWLGLNAFTILDRASNIVINPAVQVTSTNGLAFSPDGTYLAAADTNTVSLLNAASGDILSALSVSGEILSVTFTPDSDSLVIGTDYGTALIWDLSLLRSETDAEPMRAIACAQVQANLSEAEWTQYVGDGVPYQATCPNAPVP